MYLEDAIPLCSVGFGDDGLWLATLAFFDDFDDVVGFDFLGEGSDELVAQAAEDCVVVGAGLGDDGLWLPRFAFFDDFDEVAFDYLAEVSDDLLAKAAGVCVMAGAWCNIGDGSGDLRCIECVDGDIPILAKMLTARSSSSTELCK